MDTKTLSTEIRRSKAQRARQMSLDERLAAGAKLYPEQTHRYKTVNGYL